MGGQFKISKYYFWNRIRIVDRINPGNVGYTGISWYSQVWSAFVGAGFKPAPTADVILFFFVIIIRNAIILLDRINRIIFIWLWDM